MKNSIGKKILVTFGIPLLLIFIIAAGCILYMVFSNTENSGEARVREIARTNSESLYGKMETVRVSVLSTANFISKIDRTGKFSRELCEKSLKSMFENDAVYNAWLCFEPNAFDGQDALHQSDYPGAPSGRFIRSYVNYHDMIVVSPSMDESSMDIEAECPWYTIPLDTGKLYIDFSNINRDLYNYGVGDAPKYVLSISAPIFINGKAVGCLGADLIFDDGILYNADAAVAVFYPSGDLFYYPDARFVENKSSLETLGFKNKDEIIKGFQNGDTIYLNNEYSGFNGKNSFTVFRPIYKTWDYGSLYLYTALPRSAAYSDIGVIVMTVIITMLAILAALVGLIAYFIKTVSQPIQKLTLSAEAISLGDISTEIPPVSSTTDEIKLMSRSLTRMVNQFRIYVSMQERAQEQTVLFQKLNAFYTEVPNCYALLDNASILLCAHFNMSMATFIDLSSGSAKVAAQYNTARKKLLDSRKNSFPHDTQVRNVLNANSNGIVFLKRYDIEISDAQYIADDTQSACIISVKTERSLSGYAILESRDRFKPLSNHQSSLAYILNCLENALDRKAVESAKNDEPQTEEYNEPPIEAETTEAVREESVRVELKSPRLNKLLAYPEIDIYKALDMIGNMEDLYEKTLKIFVRLVGEEISQLDKYLERDIGNYAIAVHGLKGSLNNLGIYDLGKMALELELAAKESNAEYCRQNHIRLKNDVLAFAVKLEAVMCEETEQDTKQHGDKVLLKELFNALRHAADNFEFEQGLDIIAELKRNTYGAELDECITGISNMFEEFDYGRVIEKIDELGY